MPTTKGYFRKESPPTPYVTGFVFLPDLEQGMVVEFLVDTAASHTLLSPRDWTWMLPENEWLTFWRPVEVARGVGGFWPYDEIDVVVWFWDLEDKPFASFQTRIEVGLYTTSEAVEIPSLLGMDVLGKGSLTMDSNFDQMMMDIPGVYPAS